MAIINETSNILEVFDEGINDFNTLRVIFAQDNELNLTELVEEEATQTETPLENGGIMLLLTQSTSQYPPPVDAPDALESPLPGS